MSEFTAIITSETPFSSLTISDYPPIGSYILGIDTADNKLKMMDHLGNLIPIGGTTPPGGSSGQLQYNSSGSFGGSLVSTDGTNLTVPSGSLIKSGASNPYLDVFNALAYTSSQTPSIDWNNGILKAVDNFAYNIGGVNSSPLNYTLTTIPAIPGSLVLKFRSGPHIKETFTDNGLGILTGSIGDAGTINYVTGAVSVTTTGASAFYPLVAINRWNSVVNSVDWTNCELIDSSGVISINWNNTGPGNDRILYDSSGLVSILWDEREIFDNSSTTSIDYGNRLMYQNNTNNPILSSDWQNRLLYDFTGNVVSIDWGSDTPTGRQMFDYSSVLSVDWNNRWLVVNGISVVQWGGQMLADVTGQNSVYWNGRNLLDFFGQSSVDWGNRNLRDASGTFTVINWADGQIFNTAINTLSIDWSNRVLIDGIISTSVDWQNRRLYRNDNTTYTVDWQNMTQYSAGQILSIDWQNRNLIDSSNTESVSWSTRILADNNFGTISVDWQNRWLKNTTNSITVDYNYFNLYNSTENVAVDWENGFMNKNTGTPSNIATIDWQNQYLRQGDSNNYISVDWTNRILVDGFGFAVTSLDWENRYLLDSTGTFILGWGTGNIGIGTATPNSSAILDLESTTLGFLPPQMTTTQVNAIASPAAGLLVWNTTTTRYNYFDGTAWNYLTGTVGN